MNFLGAHSLKYFCALFVGEQLSRDTSFFLSKSLELDAEHRVLNVPVHCLCAVGSEKLLIAKYQGEMVSFYGDGKDFSSSEDLWVQKLSQGSDNPSV